MNNMGGMISILVAVPFIIVALVLAFIGLRQKARVSVAKEWPTTNGTVLFSTVEARRSRSSSGGTSTSYYPNVVYQYQVNGQTFQSNQLSVGMAVGLGSYNMVERRVAENYSPGSVITVYYNPANPQQAVLEHSATGGNILILVAALIVGILICTTAFTLGGMGFINNMISGFMPK
ncbi:MAG: DUF3592 domain-containing protein [Anaerolineae bacterium]|nr:DUF3592 domain-containing protein [Anaerolineae bacterium]